MVFRRVSPAQPYIFEPPLETLGFDCCKIMPPDEEGGSGSGSIYIKDLTNLNSLYYLSSHSVNLEKSGYLTAIDGKPINRRVSGSDKPKGMEYVRSIFNARAAEAEKNNSQQLLLTITTVTTISLRRGGYNSTPVYEKTLHSNIVLPFRKSEEAAGAGAGVARAVSSSSSSLSSAAAAAVSSSSPSSSSFSPSRVSLGSIDARPAGAGAGAVAPVAESSARMLRSEGLPRQLSRQPTRHRQIKILTEDITELTLKIDRQLEVPNHGEGIVHDDLTASSQLFPKITKINSANTSQIIAALYFATMELSPNGFNDGRGHNVYYRQTETPLFTANINDVSGNNANIVETIGRLESFKVLGTIQQADTTIYTSKNSAGKGDTSIYDAFKKGDEETVSLLDILKVALNQLIDIRHILGPGGNIDQFYQNFSGGNGSIKNKQQKTRRLHRIGHYNSRKRYD